MMKKFPGTRNLSAFSLLLIQTMHLHGAPTLKDLTTQAGQLTAQAGQLAAQEGRQAFAWLPKEQDKRTLVLAAGAAAGVYVTLSTLGSLWDRWSKSSVRNRIATLEARRADTETLRGEVASLHAAVANANISAWSRFYEELKAQATAKNLKLVSPKQLAEHMLNTMGALPQAQVVQAATAAGAGAAKK